ncbi:MAG: thiamine pyrophosphate-binding protein [Bdellovibrionaceae bacterium]|nr:thiamine pyrophosphate-binding protein [Bdellovibrio sp.]
MIRVSDYITEHLENIGCEAVFLLSGGGMMHLLDSVSRKKKLKYYCNHHEQCSGMAADSYARISGNIGVCYATSGPGGTNTLTAVVGAYQDSSSVLFITGQSKLSQTIEGSGLSGLRQFGTFEVDVIPGMKPYTKYAAMVKSAQDIRYHLEKALYLAKEGRPGPVFLDIPLDIQGAQIDPRQLRKFDADAEGFIKKEIEKKSDIETAFAYLTKAKRPIILAGHGIRIAGAVDLMLVLAEKMKIPVLSTCFGKDVIEYEHPLFVGHPGMKGDRAGNFAIQTADVILSVGCSMHVTTTGYEMDEFAPKAIKIIIDPDEWVLKREQIKATLKIQMDCRKFLEATLKIAESSDYHSPVNWQKKCVSWKKDFVVYQEPHKVESNQINFYNFSSTLDQLAVSSDIVVTDAGSAFYVVGQAFRVKKGQRVINSGSLGAMGFALPAATGAAVAAPQSRVLCITGDGSLQTNLHELAVFHRNKLNVKIFIINNDGYVCIRNTQNNFFKGHLAGTSADSGVFIPNLQKTAENFEIPFFKVSAFSLLEETLKKVLATPGPVFCEIITPRFQEIIPSVSSIRLENGAMKSKPLHDMFPFMDEEKLNEALEISD